MKALGIIGKEFDRVWGDGAEPGWPDRNRGVGDRVRAVFKPREEMQGNIQDILHFEIVD